MRRLSLLGFFGLLASIVAGCPIYSGDGDHRHECMGGDCSTPGCQSSQECSVNETCGADGECHSGDCTAWGCAIGTCVVDPLTSTASCQKGGTGGAGTGGAGTGGAATGGAGTGGAATGGAGTGGAGTGGAATGGAGTGGAGTGGAGTGGAATGGAGTGGAPAFICDVDGQQDACNAGSICLSHACWDACDPANQNADCMGATLTTCTTASADGVTSYFLCGKPDTGPDCDPSLAPTGCAAGKVCIGGYCE